MKLTIYNQYGEIRTTIEPSDSSTHQYGIMADNVLNLSFNLYEFIPLEVNDYIVYEDEKFELLEDYRPEMVSTIEYKYSPKFYGIQSKLKKALVLKLVDGENETSFTITDNPAVHLQTIVDNVNRISGTLDWSCGEIIDSINKDIIYDCISCYDALNKIAEAYDTEWWIEGSTINLSRCEHGNQIELGYGRGLGSIAKTSNDNAPFFTRLYPIGSSRNVTKDKYGFSRLRLPGKEIYVEQNTHLGIVEHSEETAFSHIYPRYIGKVESVRSEVVKGEDGEPFTIYYFKDPGLPFNPDDYMIPGEVLAIVFQGGELNGYDFEVNWNAATLEWEIITQFPSEGIQLPGGGMIPKKGDEYIPYNMSMPDEYYTRAEQELREAVDDYLAKHAIDVSVYKAPSDYLYFREKELLGIKLGRRVNLLSDEYFEGSRSSRVIQITRKINNPGEMDLEFSYAVKVGRMTALENNVVDIQTAFKEQLNQEKLQVLKSWDSSDPTEYNVLSAVRTIRAIANSIQKLADESDLKYLFKDREDEAAELITFCKGIEVIGEALIDRLVADNEAMFRKSLSSDKFVSGFPAGTGWAIMWQEVQNAAGVIQKKSSLEIDEVTVRGAMRIYEFIISQLSGENGTRLTTDQMRVASIDHERKTIYLDTEKGVLYNPFHEGDVVMVQQYAGMPTGENDYNLVKQYEFEVTAAGIGTGGLEREDWIQFDNFLGDPEDVLPRDVLTRVDSLTNPDRKGLIKHTSVEPGAPYMDVIYGMKTESDDAVRARLGRLTGIIDYWWGQLKGYGLFSDNVYLRGDFMLRTGDSVETLFEIVEGMLRSAIQSVTYNLTEDDNFLTNATFTKAMDGWIHESDMSLYMIEDHFINMGTNLLCEKNSIAEVVEHDGRQMLRLKNSYIRQLNEYIRKPEEDSVLYLGFRYVCKDDGVLKMGFEDTAADGDFSPREVELASSPEYRTFEISGLWDGAGDFVLEFSGDIYIEHLSLSNRPLEDYKKQVSTLFEQTESHILAVAREVDYMDKYIKEAGWITAADGHKLWATHEKVDAMGNRLTTHESSFHVTAEAISAIVTRIDEIDEEFTFLDHYVRTAGWITAADGHTLWATIDRVDLLANEIQTHAASFHVTAEAISSMVERIDTLDNTISSAGWVTTAQGNTLWARKTLENGNTIISYINQTATTITISASKIKLEGTVTANGNFKIDTYGNMTANNATLYGTVSSNSSGNRLVMDASSRSLKLINSSSRTMASLSFSEFGGGSLYKAGLTCSEYSGSTRTDYTSFTSSGLYSVTSDNSKQMTVNQNGIRYTNHTVNYNYTLFEVYVMTGDAKGRMRVRVENILRDGDTIWTGDIYAESNGNLKIKL